MIDRDLANGRLWVAFGYDRGWREETIAHVEKRCSRLSEEHYVGALLMLFSCPAVGVQSSHGEGEN